MVNSFYRKGGRCAHSFADFDAFALSPRHIQGLILPKMAKQGAFNYEQTCELGKINLIISE
jgi:hypothetical protein